MASEDKVCGACGRHFSKEKDYLQGTDQWRLCSENNLWFNCSCGSTLMIPHGKFPWYSKTMSMGEEASKIFNKISEKQELPHVSAAIIDLQVLLQDSECGNDKIEKAVRRDPFIASEVLRICSQRKAIQTGVNDPSEFSLLHAITYIGRKELQQIVLLAGLQQLEITGDSFDSTEVWEESFLIGNIAEYLWRSRYGDEGKDSAYLAGCLCNIGKFVAAIFFPESTDELWQKISDPKTQGIWLDIEKELQAPDHIVLGEVGAAFWGFPRFVMEAIRNHHDPLPEDYLQNPELCHVVCLANMLVHWVKLAPHRFCETRLWEECRFLEINESELENIISKIAEIAA